MTTHSADGRIWKIFGIRHATNTVRKRNQNFILDAEPGAPLTLDFYFWVLVSGDDVIVVDTGMSPQKAAKNGHRHLLSPLDALPALNIDATKVTTVILTHAHYDHLGFVDAFPEATFHMQAEEMAYVTGPFMRKPWFRHAYAVDEIVKLVELLHSGRLVLHGRQQGIADGVSVHWVGGHCAGQEIVRARTARGWVVLASDALHYYEEYERGVPFAVVFNSSDMLAAHDVIRDLADSDDHVIPAHDPRIADLYPIIEKAGCDHIFRLDAAPKKLVGACRNA